MSPPLQQGGGSPVLSGLPVDPLAEVKKRAELVAKEFAHYLDGSGRAALELAADVMTLIAALDVARAENARLRGRITFALDTIETLREETRK